MPHMPHPARYGRRHVPALLLLVSLCLPASSSLAQATPDRQDDSPRLQTEMLTPQTGQQENSLGARIESVEELNNGELYKIHVSLPRGEEQGELEEVIVYGTREEMEAALEAEMPTLEQKQRFEVVNDLETGRSGVVIYLGKRQNFMLRLNYTEPQPDVVPDRTKR